MDLGVAKSTLVALASEYENLVVCLFIGHSEIVPSELPILIDRDKATLSNRDPNIVYNVIQTEI